MKRIFIDLEKSVELLDKIKEDIVDTNVKILVRGKDRNFEHYTNVNILTDENELQLIDLYNTVYFLLMDLKQKYKEKPKEKSSSNDLMKIITKDNYDREDVSDHLVCENVNKGFGDLIVNLLNGEGDSDTFYMLVKKDYKLYEFIP